MISTFGEVFEVDPKIKIAKNSDVPFIEMADIEPWARTVGSKRTKKFAGGSKFLDGDVLVASRGEDEVVLSDLTQCGCLTESGDVLVILARVAGTPGVVGVGDALDVRFGELPLCAGDHLTHVAGIDEENFPMAVAVAVTVPVLCEEPQARRDSGVEEELVG